MRFTKPSGAVVALVAALAVAGCTPTPTPTPTATPSAASPTPSATPVAPEPVESNPSDDAIAPATEACKIIAQNNFAIATRDASFSAALAQLDVAVSLDDSWQVLRDAVAAVLDGQFDPVGLTELISTIQTECRRVGVEAVVD